MVDKAPRTHEELAHVLNDRPPGWEYLVFAGALILEMELLEARYEDYKLGWAPRLGNIVYEKQAHEYINIQLSELEILAKAFTHLFNSDTLAPAFGPPGESGDPARILHMAKRLISVYDEFLTWAERVRGVSAPDRYRTILDILAKYADQPIDEIRHFVDRYAHDTEEIMLAIAEQRPIVITHNVQFSIPDEASEALRAEIDRLMNT